MLDYLVSANVDISVPTETWLQTSDSNNAWVSCSSLNNSYFHLSVSNRVRRGGGLTIVYRKNLQCKEPVLVKLTPSSMLNSLLKCLAQT